MNQLPVRRKVFYGFGAMSDVIMANIVMILLMPIYNIELKVNAGLLGLALGLPRLWDALTDPFMGHISDNTRSRFGRRRPWLVVGGVLGGLVCWMMWSPPLSLSPNMLFVYFFIVSILFFTAYTIFSVPYNALGFEMTPDYDERTSVMAYKTIMMNLSTLLFLPWVYKLCFLDAFGGGDPVQGVRVVGALVGGLILLFALLPALLCRENPRAQYQEKVKFIQALKYTFKNKSFLILSGCVLCTLIGIFLAFPLMMYINLAIVFAGEPVSEARNQFATVNGWYQTTYNASGIVAVFAITWISRRIGKRRTLVGGLACVATAFLLSPFCFRPDYPYLQLVIAVLASPGLSCVWLLSASMSADICDEDELATGLRREGMFGAAGGLLLKLGVAMVMTLSGLIIEFSGFDAELSTQSAYTINFLRYFFAGTPLVFLLTAIVLAYKFPLSRERMAEIKQQLAERKMASHSDAS